MDHAQITAEQRAAGERNGRAVSDQMRAADERRRRRYADIARDANDSMLTREYAITNYQVGIYATDVARGAPVDACMHPADLVRHRSNAARELRRRKIPVPAPAETLLPDEILRWQSKIDRTGILRKEVKRRE